MQLATQIQRLPNDECGTQFFGVSLPSDAHVNQNRDTARG